MPHADHPFMAALWRDRVLRGKVRSSQWRILDGTGHPCHLGPLGNADADANWQMQGGLRDCVSNPPHFSPDSALGCHEYSRYHTWSGGAGRGGVDGTDGPRQQGGTIQDPPSSLTLPLNTAGTPDKIIQILLTTATWKQLLCTV